MPNEKGPSNGDDGVEPMPPSNAAAVATEPPRPRSSIILGNNVVIDLDTFNEDDEDKLPIWWNIRRTTQKPCLCCCQLCGCWAFLLILLLILVATVATIEFSLGVPFYDRSELNQERADAYAAVEEQADFLTSFGVGGVEGNCVHDDPTVLTRHGDLLEGPMPTASCQRATSNELRLLYISKDRKSNILTPENLQEIKNIEDRILDTLGLTRYCYLINSTFPPITSRDVEDLVEIIEGSLGQDDEYVACERIFSPLNFMDEAYFDISGDESGFGYYLMPQDQFPQEYDFSAENIDTVVNYWTQFTPRTYNLTSNAFLVATLGDRITVDNLFLRATSGDFTLGSTETIGLTSTFALGFAINDYFSATEDLLDQVEDAGQWLWDEFDSFLKDASFEGVDVYWADSEDGMRTAEEGYLAAQSFVLFPLSVVLVMLYLITMQDSFFIGLAGIGQILLCFIPTLLLYRYVVGEDYLGVLNIISFYIILGIGVDDIFVFSDQFALGSAEPDLTRRMQIAYKTASKAMFTTSCTTFISFMSNASSVFPAVATFGTFSALLVLCNFLAVTIYFPAVYAVYRTRVMHRWWDHPSLLFRCKREVPEEGEGEEGESRLTLFFKRVWAPMVIKLRFVVMAFFVVVAVLALVITLGLEPEEDAPTTIPSGNNYLEFGNVLRDYFGRADNPTAIRVHLVSGIDPDDPIDRSGTDDTNLTDYGDPNYLDCSVFDPTTPESQVWSLMTCHDMFFGNVTAYHGDRTDLGENGTFGPRERRLIDDTVLRDEFNYYGKVSCIAQGFRDWLLTDNGCIQLQDNQLDCYTNTSAREGCVRWDTNGNSCEPFPVPQEFYLPLFIMFLQDPAVDPSTQETNFDKYSEQVFVAEVSENPDLVVQADFSCRSSDDLTMLSMVNVIGTTVQGFAQNYEDGLDLYEKWDNWMTQMQEFAPRQMIATYHNAQGTWAFYFLNETLLGETFSGIALSLGLSFLVLAIVGGNVLMALYSVLTIMLIVLDVFAFTVIAGYSLGVIEAVLYVVVIGMSIDYSVHMSEAFTEAHGETRQERVVLMIEEMGVSVLSGALSTLLAAFPMFFAPNTFFVKFAAFLFVTIALSCIYALTFFPALCCLIGPMGNAGSLYGWLGRLKDNLFHEATKRYIQSQTFLQREQQKQQAKKEEEPQVQVD